MRNKITSAAEAVAIVQSGDAICTSGFVGIGAPDALLVALEKRFLDTGEPRDLTLLFAAGQGTESRPQCAWPRGSPEARRRRPLGSHTKGRTPGLRRANRFARACRDGADLIRLDPLLLSPLTINSNQRAVGDEVSIHIAEPLNNKQQPAGD
jgi:hypothetical protein